MSIKYDTGDGESVTIPNPINPYEVLGITKSSSRTSTKNALKKLLTSSKREDRAVASLAYHMITSPDKYWKKENTFEIRDADIFVWAAMGHIENISTEVAKDNSAVNATDEYNRTVIYFAARGGFGDIVELLIQKEANINCVQNDKSTPLHAAAYYGLGKIVKMLLVYGANTILKNNSKHTPSSESAGDIKLLFHEYETDPLGTAVEYFGSCSLTEKAIPIVSKKNVIGFEILRSHTQRDTGTIHQWYTIKRDWKIAYYGAKLKLIKPILINGVLSCGNFVPKVTQTAHAEVVDWAKAIMVSPNILCATYSDYWQHIGGGDSRWYVVVKVYVNPSNYTEYSSTAAPRDEPSGVEQSTLASPLRRSRESLTDDLPVWVVKNIRFDREEHDRNVAVASILLIDHNFRQNVAKLGITSEDLQKLFESKF